MDVNFDRILDECIDRINRGDGVEACLAGYPDHMEQLEPLLQAMLKTQSAYSFVPSADSKLQAKQLFNAARAKLEYGRQEKQTLFARAFARPVVWATVAAAIAILLVGYVGLKPLLYPTGPAPNPEGNFIFLISDDVNAIKDFQSLDVSISKIALLKADESEQWVEFRPEVTVVDLTQVQGEDVEEVWRGDVPEGEYTSVYISVSHVSGVLKESGQEVEVKLPSQKLHMSKTFNVSAETVTSFTYDLTVIAAGSPQSGIKYILKPQIDQSGASHEPKASKGADEKPEKPGKR